MKRIVCFMLVAIMFIALVTSCDAIDIEGRMKYLVDQNRGIDQEIIKRNNEIAALNQQKIENIGRLKALQEIKQELEKEEAPPVEE